MYLQFSNSSLDPMIIQVTRNPMMIPKIDQKHRIDAARHATTATIHIFFM